MSDIAGNDKAAEAAMRIFLAHHEKFHFALQDKYEELIKYAQRKDASQFLIDKGNREIKEAADYLNAAKNTIEALNELVEFTEQRNRIKRREKEIKELRQTLKQYGI